MSSPRACSIVVEGEMGDFEDRYEELYVSALRAAGRVVVDRETARDVAAEAVARAYGRWRAVEAHGQAWVTRVAVNLALDVVRRKPAPAVASAPTIGEPSLDRVVLASALARLPRRQREAVVLRYLLDLDEEQTAQMLGVTVGTVHTHVTRALARIRRDLPGDMSFGVDLP
jgi:RNA polymerase sigma-70 factor (ECF subfamily)